MSISRIRKAIVAGVAFAAVLATQLPPGSPEWLTRWAPVVITAATVLGVYGTRNAVPPSRQAGRSHQADEVAEQLRPSRIATERPPPKSQGGYPSGDTRVDEMRPPVPPPPDPGKPSRGR